MQLFFSLAVSLYNYYELLARKIIRSFDRPFLFWYVSTYAHASNIQYEQASIVG